MRLSHRVQRLQPSPTLAIQAKASALKAAGQRVLSLAAGEPDFPTPENIRKAAIAAMQAGHTGYAPSAGILLLRETICNTYRQELGLTYSDDQVVVSCGAKQCLYNAFHALLDSDSQAIVQAPYWVSYPEQIRLCGAVPVIIPPPPQGVGLNLEAISSSVNQHTRVVVINSPCNPTGHVLTETDLDALAELALAHDLVVISDDIYGKLLYDGHRLINIVQRVPEMIERTVLVNGLSKSYCMTGWRLGYAVGPASIIGAMRKIQDQSTSNAVTFVQHAAVEALTSPPELVHRMVEVFDQRRKKVHELLSGISGVECSLPAGTFYVFPSFSRLLGRRPDGQEVGSTLQLAELLLEHKQVAVVPGEAFGAPGHLRISFAASDQDIEEGMQRLHDLVKELH